MALFGSKKKSLQVSLTARKRVATGPSPLPPLLNDAPERKLFKNGRKTALIFFLLATFGILSFSFSQSFETFASQVASNLRFGNLNPAQSPLEVVVSEVKKQYLVPEGETPTLAVITSLEELAGQPFFAKAQVGDARVQQSIATPVLEFSCYAKNQKRRHESTF